MSKGKKIGIAFLSLLFTVCLVIDVWFLWVKFFGDEKILSNSTEIEEIELEDGTKSSFVEVKYNSNKNGNGYEMLDIKFNSLLDETKTMFVSQGFQYIAKTQEDSIGFSYVYDQSDDGYQLSNNGSLFGYNKQEWNNCGWYDLGSGTNRYTYYSADNWQTAGASTEPLAEDSLFKITIGGEIYGVRFVGKYKSSDESNCVGSNLYQTTEFRELFGHLVVRNWYAYTDFNHFAKRIYEYVQSLSDGTSRKVILPFGNMFEFYEFDGKQYSKEKLTATELVELDINSFVVVEVNVSDDGARKASDSIFNCVNGSQGFNIMGDYSSSEYFTGQAVINVDVYDFDLVQVTEGQYCLKLDEAFVENYLSVASQCVLNVEINLDILHSKNVEFVGFAKDSGLDNFNIGSCYTLKWGEDGYIRTEVRL